MSPATLTFLDPWMLLLAAGVPLALALRARRGEPALTFTPAPLLARVASVPGWRVRLRGAPLVLEACGVLLAVVALARPVEREALPIEVQGVDIVLGLDVSSSMTAADMDGRRPRLEVAKEAAARFITARPHDRIALVTFARYPDLRCPFTLDHAALQGMLAAVTHVAGEGREDATALGAALALAARMLRTSSAPSKLVILLTDGDENVATTQAPKEIAPLHAAQLCKELGIRVYPIIAGSKPADPSAVPPHPQAGQAPRLAEITDGAAFEARDAGALAAVYERIDALERTAFPDPQFRILERFVPFLLSGIALLLAARALRAALFEALP